MSPAFETFDIFYWWEKWSEPRHPVELVDITKVGAALYDFCRIYEGGFTIHTDGLEPNSNRRNLFLNVPAIAYELHPDLTLLFEDIPFLLETLTTDTESPVFFEFYEQDMAVERQGPYIIIRFDSVSRRYESVPDVKIPVLADEFLTQWLQFVRALLDALVALQPDLANDESYRTYRSQLDVVESRK